MKKAVKVVLLFFLVSFLLFLQTLSTQAAAPTDRHDRPIPMGVSISTTPSSPFIFAGTAGMLVRSFLAPEQKFILSNNHVMGAVGPTLCPNTASEGTPILQPGTLDIGMDPGDDPFYRVANLTRFIPIRLNPLARNLVDAAIASTTPDLASNEILDIGPPNPGFVQAMPGMEVVKSGRTTGVTFGTVEAINVTVLVSYGTRCGIARFVHQATVTPGSFSAGGDSGSVILEESSNTPVGLLFAGSSTSTVMNPILLVYLLLGVFVD